MLCMFLLYFGKTTVEKRTEVVHLMFFGSLKVFAYIIKMHLIILPRVDTTISVRLIFLCHVSGPVVNYVFCRKINCINVHLTTLKGINASRQKQKKSFITRCNKFAHVHEYYKLVVRSNSLPEYTLAV